MNRLTTRRASPADFSFVYALHHQEFFAYIDQTWGWQEDAQRKGMRSDFEDFPFQIICWNGQAIGAISAIDQGEAVLLKYLAIRSKYQRRGFGTKLLREVLEQADRRDLPVKLTVLRVNPAKDFYQRLGFAIVQEDDACLQMVKFPQIPLLKLPCTQKLSMGDPDCLAP